MILRRYTANWAVPDDRKINPWDLNEPDPRATGSTIPGPTLERAVGEEFVVHVRNKDQRAGASLLDSLGGELVHLEHRAAGVGPGPDEVLVGDQLVTVPPHLVLQPGTPMFAASHNLRAIIGALLPHYRTPPSWVQYLLLFHELTGAPGMCINGRVWLGNTPTFLGGPETVMRFGVVGIGNNFHTLHLHGHRWTLTGPDGTDTGSIQGSPQVRVVSQFEDTRTFGPANSFAFTIREATSFMGAPPEPAAGATGPGSLGEWHMHCHVLWHMMGGMMGSLLIVQGGEVAGRLPRGPPRRRRCLCLCRRAPSMRCPSTTQFDPTSFAAKMGDVVGWTNNDVQDHTVTSDPGSPKTFDRDLFRPGHGSRSR